MNQRNGQLIVAVAFLGAIFVSLLAIPVAHCVALSLGLSTFGSCSGSIRAYLVLGPIFALPAALLFGVPLYLLFRRLGWLSWWQVPLGAGLSGILAALALHLLDSTIYLPATLGLFGGLGILSGIAFWFFGLRRRVP